VWGEFGGRWLDAAQRFKTVPPAQKQWHRLKKQWHRFSTGASGAIRFGFMQSYGTVYASHGQAELFIDSDVYDYFQVIVSKSLNE